MRSRAALLTLAGLAAAASIGCGPTERAPDAIATAERFHAALSDLDGAAACAELTASTIETLERQEDRPCAEAVLDLDLPAGARPRQASVHVSSASVALAGGSTDFLDEGPDGWRISAAGCRPAAPDMPYDCGLAG